MIRALLMLATQFGVLDSSGGTYIVINEIYNAVFSFLPVYLAYCAAKRFKCNEMIAVAVSLAMFGRNTINAVTGPSNWAQAGAAMGVFLKSRNRDIRETALSASVTGIFSITEPSIYGVNLKYKTPFYAAVVFGAVAGGIAGAGNAAALAEGPVGILSFPLFIGEGFVHFVIAMFVAFVGSAVGAYFLYDRKNDAA